VKGVVDLDANRDAYVDVLLQETITPRLQYFETKYIKTSISPSYSFSWWRPKYTTWFTVLLPIYSISPKPNHFVLHQVTWVPLKSLSIFLAIKCGE
jgi:hypothetical protein